MTLNVSEAWMEAEDARICEAAGLVLAVRDRLQAWAEAERLLARGLPFDHPEETIHLNTSRNYDFLAEVLTQANLALDHDAKASTYAALERAAKLSRSVA